MKTKVNLLVVAAACSLFTFNDAVYAQGTAFTYQGRLNSGTNAANGSFDVQFTLFSAGTGGSSVAGPVVKTAIGVTNGLFTATVDFGGVFPVTTNWLELAVRTNGAASFGAPLTPRQQLTPTPYAIYAETANGAGLTGTISGNGSGLTSLSASQLSAGTLPDTRLSANVALLNANQTFSGSNNFSSSGILSSNTLQFGAGIAGQEANAGKIGYETFTTDSLDIVGAGTNGGSRKIKFWAEGGALFNGPTTIGGTGIFNGNVGIGTKTPQITLDVYAPVYAQVAAQFGVANCGAVCAQTDYQEAIRLWNQNGNGQVGIGFTVGGGSFSSNAVPGVWLGTSYADHANDFKIATVVGTNLTDRVYINGSNGNFGIGTKTPATALQVNGIVTATSFSGSGSGLTGLAAANLSGSVPDVNLSGNIALLNRSVQSFTGGTNSFTGRVGINTTAPIGRLSVQTAQGMASIMDGQFSPELVMTGGAAPGVLRLRNVLEIWPNTNATTAATLSVRDTNGNATITLLGGSGAIGIGTVSPAEKLVVTGGADFTSAANNPNTDNGVGVSFESYGGRIQSFQNKPLVLNPVGNNVGIGTTNPVRQLTVKASGYGIEHTDGTVRLSTYIGSGGGWLGTVSAHSLNFFVNDGGVSMTIGLDGNATFAHEVSCTALNLTSDRNAKEDFKSLNPREVLDKVTRLPITEWQYKADKTTDADAARHIGPMAQDFSAAFALGHDDKHISVIDEGGVALAAIQGLNEKVEEKDARIEKLEKTVAELKALISQLADRQNGGAK